MFPRSRRLIATLAVTVAVAGGAVAHAAASSSGPAGGSTSTPAMAAADPAPSHHTGKDDCPNMRGDQPSTTPSTTPPSGSRTPSTSTTGV